MKILKAFGLAAGLVFGAAAANAAPIYADSVIDFTQGSCLGPCDPARSIDTNALGAPDDAFVSIGLGGEITLGFPGTPLPGGSTATTYEITTNRLNEHKEAADVYSVLGGVETFLGTVFNAPSGVGSVFVTGAFDAIKLVDVSLSVFPATTSFDGYDVDAVSISAIPLPASGLVFLAALGGLGLMRRKKA